MEKGEVSNIQSGYCNSELPPPSGKLIEHLSMQSKTAMKNIATLFFLLFGLTPVFNQVTFNLSYQVETKSYTISLIPNISWQASQNKVGSAQIVLRVPSGLPFFPAITSQIEDVNWADNVYLENPDQAPGYTFIGIAMVNGPTDKISFSEGIEVPLFSFVNAAGGCPGRVELTPNDDPMVESLIAAGFNFTQHIAVLGARGNAFSGIAQGTADCGLISSTIENVEKLIDQIRIAPSPADEQVTVSWTRQPAVDLRVDLVIYSISGQEVFHKPVSNVAGDQSLKITVKNWTSGLYHLSFQYSDGRRTAAHNLIVNH